MAVGRDAQDKGAMRSKTLKYRGSPLNMAGICGGRSRKKSTTNQKEVVLRRSGHGATEKMRKTHHSPHHPPYPLKGRRTGGEELRDTPRPRGGLRKETGQRSRMKGKGREKKPY